MNAPQKICILYDPDSGPIDPGSYLGKYQWELKTIVQPVEPRLRQLPGLDFDVYFNLCDGAADETRPGLDVVQWLERLRLPFTGAESAFYDPTRAQMKTACQAAGLPYPQGWLIESSADLAKLPDSPRFPLLVKHPNSYGSMGLTKDCLVYENRSLREKILGMMEKFSAAFVEEFVAGREFSVLVADNPQDLGRPLAFAPVEFLFPPGESFRHYDIKWFRYREVTYIPVRDAALAKRLMDVSVKMYLGLGGTGYGRCDIRMSADGTPYLLEINPNCGILCSSEEPATADYILQNDPRGHDGFLNAIFRAALLRHRLRHR
jgi:D-alanine-D-alanine ligase